MSSVVVDEEEETKKDNLEGGEREQRECGVVDNSKGGEEEEEEDEEEEEEEELTDLPEELTALVGDRRFGSDDELQSFLDTVGFGDLKVVLVNGGVPRQVNPSHQHNAFKTRYLLDFLHWAKNKWGCATATHNIHTQNGGVRHPDLSYWGYPRCRFDKGTLLPKNPGSIPDVVIQLSWNRKNKKATYDEDAAMNDMMNHGLEEQGRDLSMSCPRLGYLIKVRFSKKRRMPGGDTTQDIESLDVYKLPHGTTVTDAVNGVNGAEMWNYDPAVGPDRMITITPKDLGITGFWAMVCGNHEIASSGVFRKLDKCHKHLQSLGLLT